MIKIFLWRKKNGGGQAKEYFVIEHEYIVVYRRSEHLIWQDKVVERDASEYNKRDEKGSFKVTKLAKWGNTARREDRPTMYFPIIAPDGEEVYPIAPDGGDGRWRVGKPRMNEIIENELVYWENRQGIWIPYEKEYFEGQSKTIKERSILYDVANTGDGSNELTDLFGRKDTFENPKPSILLKKFLEPLTKMGFKLNTKVKSATSKSIPSHMLDSSMLYPSKLMNRCPEFLAPFYNKFSFFNST